MSKKKLHLTLIAHLEELRSRVLFAVFITFLMCILVYPVTDDLVLKISDGVLGEYQGKVVVTSPLEAVMVRFKLSLLLGLFLAVPVVLYELFGFISPGLFKQERQWMIITMLGSFALFALGAGFTYMVLLPVMVPFLIGFATPMAVPLMRLDSLMSFIFTLMAGMGVVFQWPLVAAVCARLGIVSANTLAEKRRYAILAAFIAGAVITDPTFITQIIVAVPMIILYEIGIIAAKMVGAKK